MPAELKTYAFAVMAARCVSFLVAVNTDDAVILRCELLVADWLLTFVTSETLFVPFPTLELEFLHSYKHQLPPTDYELAILDR